MNTLYYGDNLHILRDHIPAESVDLVYLDPPFNSNRSYNVLFKEPGAAAKRRPAETASASEAQIAAFDDTWHWGPSAEAALRDLQLRGQNPQVVKVIEALVEVLGRQNDMTAYLVMMAVRLVELHRVLKPTGSLYLHCDPTASHYLKVVLDAIFGTTNFRNEIVWRRQSAHSDARTKFPDVADIILFYGKSDKTQFKPQYGEHNPDYVAKFYRFDDGDGRGPYSLDNMASPNPRPNMMYEWLGFPYPQKGWRYQRETMQRLHNEGRIWYPRKDDGTFDMTRRPRLKRYLHEQEGSIITNIWVDVQSLHAVSGERLGYPTQKPLALLERILQASSNPGDLVLDPFCGCGTTVCAAQKLGRRWIGIDITHLAVSLMEHRLRGLFGDAVEYEVVGVPRDLASARALAERDRYQFQYWAVSLVKGQPIQATKKGADRGVDGLLRFVDERDRSKVIVVQVKSGHVQANMISELCHVVEREKAALGFFITLEPPTRPMEVEALEAGYYHSPGWNRDYPRIQLRTIEQLLRGEGFSLPPANITLAQSDRLEQEGGQQRPLW